MKEIFGSPLFIYVVVLLFLGIYIIYAWEKESTRTNILFLILSILMIFNYNSFDVNNKYLLDSFHSDTIYFKFDNRSVAVKLKYLFQEKNVVFTEKESIVEYLKDIMRDPVMEFKFYKKDKEMLTLKMYETNQENKYSFYFNNKLVVLKYNGYLIRYNKVFYENLNKFIDGGIYEN